MDTLSKKFGTLTMPLLVLLAISFSALPVFGQYGGGSGTAGDPYLIYTPTQMYMIGAMILDYDKHFRLMADIDLSAYTGTSFFIIGSSAFPFTGVFDGNGHTISNFTYTSTGTNYIGVFGYVDGASAEIKDLGLINAEVDAGTGDNVGSLVGLIQEGSITNCYTEGGSVTGDYGIGGLVGSGGTITDCYSEAVSVSGKARVGGLVGEGGNISDCSSIASVSGTQGSVGGLVGSGGNISNCYSTGSVSGIAGSFGLRSVGGLVGFRGTIRDSYSAGSVSVSGTNIWGVGGLAGTGGNITNCYSSANVSASGSNVHGTGGLVGVGQSGNIANCYSTGSVSGVDNVGGLMGENIGIRGTVVNCYSTGSVSGITGLGGLVGYNNDLVSACFWDKQRSGRTNMCGSQGSSGSGCDNSYGKTTAEMQDVNTFLAAGWDFVNQADGPSDDWAELETQGYMILWWQLPEDQLPALPTFSGGTGEPGDPYLIATSSDLNRIGHNPRLMAASPHFKLVNDIDLTGIDFFFIGSRGYDYSGIFNGNGHIISNFTYSSTGASYIGLFGAIRGKNAEVKDLGLINPNIDAGAGGFVGSLVGSFGGGTITDCYAEGVSVTGGEPVGGLVGENSGAVVNCNWTGSVSGTGVGVGGLVGDSFSGTITKCHSNGIVSSVGVAVGGLVGLDGVITDCSSTCDVSGIDIVGGLVGSAGTVTNCYALGDVSGEQFVGGLVGGGGTVTKCYSAGSVTGDNRVGGLIGEIWGGTISNCYSTGDVSGNLMVGGLVGLIKGAELGADGNISNCYSTGNVTGTTEVGGLVGRNGGTASSTFWDTQNSGRSNMCGSQGTSGSGCDNSYGKTTGQMQTMSTFLSAGWDFANVWDIDEGKSYPKFQWDYHPVGDFDLDKEVNLPDFGIFSAAWLSTPADPNSWNPACDLYDPNETPPYPEYVLDPNDVIIDVLDLEIFSEHWLEGTAE